MISAKIKHLINKDEQNSSTSFIDRLDEGGEGNSLQSLLVEINSDPSNMYSWDGIKASLNNANSALGNINNTARTNHPEELEVLVKKIFDASKTELGILGFLDDEENS